MIHTEETKIDNSIKKSSIHTYEIHLMKYDYKTGSPIKLYIEAEMMHDLKESGFVFMKNDDLVAQINCPILYWKIIN